MRLGLVHHVPALADGLDDQPLGDEAIGDPDPLIEQAARVAAQVEHQPLAAAVLRPWPKLVEQLAQLAVGARREDADLDVADAVLEQPPSTAFTS